ncbi:sodium/hydrogen exchanger 9B2-like [Xyrauchen texanus]|uniref:sodium/hydrogen exchanger 9B2-like n=1 Tax=Xyrauchen texanus TaxID=154827 RepID=UPI0022427639|nr:sodium/hydrogen exchanger 9B2-like [Xyrauchen texanus]XP_051982699.1 sodium/hydrogen exchanger 9B2-like [Xyrauchen texanus]XP_051982700.1 sodium/hydrogen exchanger 9B2-like [Xyrauchen texanus]XP_051982701.1 sodium/hydrogen exchanger 9B2-like [Xyrauchen texanus]
MEDAQSRPHSSHSIFSQRTEDGASTLGNHAEHHLTISQTVLVVAKRSESPSQSLAEETIHIPQPVSSVDACTNTEPPYECCPWLRRVCPCPPRGLLATIITKVTMAAVLFGVVLSITEKECLPGGNLFGIVTLFICSVAGGKLFGRIQFPNLPPLPPLLGMLLAGFILRNIPVVTDAIYIDVRWSASLRNIALAVILVKAGLELDGKALRKLKAVCLRLSILPLTFEATTMAVVSYLLLGLPWAWGFILGFVLGAVSPAVVVPSMLLLQKQGYGAEQGIPTLLMAACSTDDIVAITCFTTCLGVAFATGTVWLNVLRGPLEVLGGLVAGVALGYFLRYFPSRDQGNLVLKRSFLVLGLSVFALFGSNVAGIPGAGGLCTLLLAFVAGIGWGKDKDPVVEIVERFWDVFQPLLFGLIGAEIVISALEITTVSLGIACLFMALTVRLLITFAVVLRAGFNLKEKVFIALAWMPKATVQAAIGSTALDMARSKNDLELQKYGMDVLTVAVLSILITAPIGALVIGLLGPRMLQKPKNPEWAVSQGALSASGTPATYESAL